MSDGLSKVGGKKTRKILHESLSKSILRDPPIQCSQFDDPPHSIHMKFGDPPMLDPPPVVNDMFQRAIPFKYIGEGVGKFKSNRKTTRHYTYLCKCTTIPIYK